MNGKTFVSAVFLWLILNLGMVVVVVAALTQEPVYATLILSVVIGVIWVPLTLRWAWLASMYDQYRSP